MADQDTFKPYIADDAVVAEFTPKAIIFGALFGILFGAPPSTSPCGPG